MKRLLLVTPVYMRYRLTEIMLKHRKKTFAEARDLGVECQCAVIGDVPYVKLAEDLGFIGFYRANYLGAKYNTGHQYAVEAGYDYSFHCNSDQVFDPRLLKAISESPEDKCIKTKWLTNVHKSGEKALTYRNPLWSMTAYPTKLLAKNPRPCQEDLMSMCDTSTRQGVTEANPTVTEHLVEVGPLETIQFESSTQLTPWKKNLMVAMRDGVVETSVPWAEIGDVHGYDLVKEMRDFYGLTFSN